MKPAPQSSHVGEATGEEVIHITILEKLLLTFGHELLGKFGAIGFDPVLPEQIDEVDEIVESFDPADHLPVHILFLRDHLSEVPEVAHW